MKRLICTLVTIALAGCNASNDSNDPVASENNSDPQLEVIPDGPTDAYSVATNPLAPGCYSATVVTPDGKRLRALVIDPAAGAPNIRNSSADWGEPEKVLLHVVELDTNYPGQA